ncbi:MAG TPA: hypothetical protein VLT85_08450 [Terriglobales bacterium]|nr:hypothetical protein [Terriglobales bacterium]
MKRASSFLTLFLLIVACGGVWAQQPKEMPQLVVNAHYVYVTSYDGNQWSPNLLPEDRQAISDVQDALRKWGKYIVVYRPQDAEIILAVQKRGSEDVLAVYQAGLGFSSNPLWRGMRQGGLDSKEMGLMVDFQRAVEKAETAK